MIRTKWLLNICAIFPVILWAGIALANDGCLPYEPSQVVLRGKLERRTFPGPPNYESIANGDAAETGYYLSLESPICTKGNEKDPSNQESYEGVQLVQIVLDQEGYSQLRPMLGHVVGLRGQLFAQITGHHHTSVLLNFVAVEKDR